MLKISSIQRTAALVLLVFVLPSGCQIVAGLTSFTVDEDGGVGKADGGGCKGSLDCPSDMFCTRGRGACADCGLSPPNPACTAMCPACAQNICTLSCSKFAGGKCQSNEQIHADVGPAEITCGSECNGVHFTCIGPHPCTLVCGDGCGRVTLTCALEGACKVKCTGTGCADAVTQWCGENACEASCAGQGKVVQVCNSACSCAHPGCSP